MRRLFSLILVFICHIGCAFSSNPVLLFDCGGVICKPDQNAMYEWIQKTLYLSSHEMKLLIDSMEQAQREGIYDKIFWREYEISHGIALPEDWFEMLGDCYVASIHEMPGMVQLIKGLQSKGFKTPMLSNIAERHARVLAEKGIYDLFHPVFLSCSIGAWKPDRLAFDYVLDQLQITPQECIFIDDEIQNIRAARELGIDAILFESAEQLQAELSSRNL